MVLCDSFPEEFPVLPPTAEVAAMAINQMF
jgi:hypothetical protein